MTQVYQRIIQFEERIRQGACRKAPGRASRPSKLSRRRCCQKGGSEFRIPTLEWKEIIVVPEYEYSRMKPNIFRGWTPNCSSAQPLQARP